MISQLRSIRGITNDEVVSLLKAGYQDQEDLQKALDDGLPAIERIAKNAKLEPNRVAELLDASLRQSSDQLFGSWLSRYRADLLLFIVLLVLVMLPHLGKVAEEKEAKIADTEKVPRVIAERDLLPYVPLKPADLASRNYVSSKEASERIIELVNRYPTHLIKAHEIVDDISLSKNKAPLDRFSILRVTLKTKPAWEGIALPRKCELLFSAHGTVPGGTKLQVQLLDLTSDGLNATIGVPNEQLAEVARWIGNSDAYLFFRVR